MGKLSYKIGYDESITRWWITKMQKEEFKSPYKTFDAPVNEGEGYVQIVYPVREEFLIKNKTKEVQIYQGEYNDIYFPFENNRVDFTTFIHMPHHIWIYAKSGLYVEDSGKYPFELYTCGGVKIWLNQQEITCFTPYSRNIPEKLDIELDLKAGYNEILIYADELAERDVFFYYELRYKGHGTLDGVLEIEGDIEDITDTEKFLTSCYFEKDLLTSGNAYLNYDNKLLKGDKKILIEGDAHAAKLSNIEIGNTKIVTVKMTQDKTDLGSIKDFNVGAFKILVSCETGRFKITRELVLAINPDDYIKFQPAKDIKGRKKQALSFISEHGEDIMSRAMAIVEIEDKFNEKAYECINKSVKRIENKEDCADFVLVPSFLLITKYREYLSEQEYERIKTAILDFRYWIDEPGNDVMWYFSENHALLFHIGQYMAGYLFPGEIFKVSGKSGKQQYIIGRERVEEWMNNFFQYGYAEWNSATYIPIDLIGFFILYEMAPDELIRKQAKRALDFTFKIISYNSFHGVMSSSYGRAYEDTLKAARQNGPNFFHWVATGERLFSGGNRPCYWAGNGTIPFIEQYGNTMIMLFKIDPNELVHYIHAYTPLYLYDEYEINNKWFFIRVQDSYLATWFSNGIRLTQYGANTGKEIISEGLNHGVIIKCGSTNEFGSFEEFKRCMKKMDAVCEYDGNEKLSFIDPQYGQIKIENSKEISVAGKILEYNHMPEMEIKKGKVCQK